MTTWAATVGTTDIKVDTDHLSKYLVVLGGPLVSDLARQGAVIAADQTTDPRSESLIDFKTNVESPKPFGFPLQSLRLGQLSRGLSIPVGLVINNSKNAVLQEVGSADGSVPATRPLLTAYNRLRGKNGVTGVRGLVRNAAPGSFRRTADAARRARGQR